MLLLSTLQSFANLLEICQVTRIIYLKFVNATFFNFKLLIRVCFQTKHNFQNHKLTFKKNKNQLSSTFYIA